MSVRAVGRATRYEDKEKTGELRLMKSHASRVESCVSAIINA
jgi:hypothetical protein